MQGVKRRLVYVGLYELIAILLTALLLKWMTNGSPHSVEIAIASSAIAILWNLVFNYGFEFWEARNNRKNRTIISRLFHAVGFEGGLVILLVPMLAWWLDVSWLQALAMDLGLLMFFWLIPSYSIGYLMQCSGCRRHCIEKPDWSADIIEK